MRKTHSESGRTLLETLAVLVVIAILLIASIAGYNFLIHQWRKNQTVKQITELAVRYKLRPIQPTNGVVDIKPVFPEAERASAFEMITADTETGRVSIRAKDTTTFSIVVNDILADSCEATLKNGKYKSVLYKNGQEEYDEDKELFVLSEDLLKNWDKVPADKKPEELRAKTKEQIIANLCADDLNGKIRNMSLVDGNKCPEMGFSYGYAGKCWSCPSSQKEDKYGACCVKPEEHDCGVCKCPDGAPICDKDGSGQCVECLVDTDCAGTQVCSDEHKCIPCRPYTTDGCVDEDGNALDGNKKWCSSWYKCEECLENYDPDNSEGFRCSESKALCDKTGGLETWHCQEWPCAQNLFLETCRDGVSGSITLGGKCSEDVCRCAAGLECKPGEEGQCSTCQCIDDVPADLTAPAEGRQKGQACNTDGTCPCGKNNFGIQLTCVDNVCSCLADGESCGTDSDCCGGSCFNGKCGPKSCQKEENDTECSIDATDYANCCVSGTTCQSIRGSQVCCSGNGQDEAFCTNDSCCDTGFVCDTVNKKCVPETICSDEGACIVGETTGENACCSGQTCIAQKGETEGSCCPQDTNGDGSEGAKCSSDNCCESGHCEDEDGDGVGVCVNACDGTWIGEGATKTCCDNTGENGTTCVSDACCTSGKCVKANATDETGICCGADDSDGADCSNNLCCASGKCTNNKCCPTTLPVEGQTCSVACGCQEGYNCDPETLKCVPPTCPNTEEDRQQEGATCSEYCPCGVNSSSGEQMTCGSDGKCHTCASGTWRQAEGKSGACCPVAEGLDLGSVCTNDSCCKSGNCSIAEGESEGHCCQSAYTWIQDLKDSSSGQCCASVVSEGDKCSGKSDKCCETGYCRQVYTKMVATTSEQKTYPCLKWKEHKEKCETCHCGHCTKSTCYWDECKKYDYNSPQTVTKTSAYADKGLGGPYKCCEGNGDLGSPCSEECPCQGTAFQYYVDGKLTKTEIKTTEYKSVECSCKKIPLLYCRPEGNGKGTCQLNPYVLATKEKSYKATAMNCAYSHDFSNTNNGKCYLCPADSSFRENSDYVGCCPPGSLTVTEKCARYQKEKGYVSAYEEGEMLEGFYLDELTGRKTLCSKGFFCIGGHRYPCEEGTYSDTQGATSCHYCGKGNFCSERATQRNKCLAGYYCPEWDTKRDQMENEYFCPPGTYSTAGASSASACKACPKNYYCPGKSDKIACDGKNLPGECPETGMEAPIEGKPGQYLKSKKLTTCEKGYYCDGIRRFACKAGTYANKKGMSECTPAPAGVAITVSASTGSKDKTTGAWKICPAGTYAAGTGNIECTSCPSGTYQDKTGQSECKTCPDGARSDVGAKAVTSCQSCSGDVAKVSAVQTACCSSSKKAVTNEATGYEICCAKGKDRYCKNQKGTYGCNLAKDCALSEEEVAATACTNKQYISSGKCTACTEGHSCNGSTREICPVGTYAPKGSGVCTPCPVGSYQSKIGQSECIYLWKKNADGEYKTGVSNKYTDTEGSSTYKVCTGDTVAYKAHNKCVTCPEGRKPSSDHSKCDTICKKGEMYANGGCRRCQQNYYCPNGWQELPCPEYKYSLPGAKECTSCGNGKYWNSNSGKCVTCEAGNFCADGIKKPCPAGSVSGSGATQCSKCNPGEYFNTTKTSCQPCAAGTYSNGGTVTACTKCPKGQYQSQTGKSSCEKCPAGTYESKEGSKKCNFCGEKKWYEGTGATAANQCTTCPAGYYCTSKGVKTICPAGSKCPAGSASATECAAGTYQDTTGQTSCKKCPTGSISKAGAKQCTPCGEGKYSSTGKTCSTCSGAGKAIFTNKDGFQTCCTGGKTYKQNGQKWGCY